MAGGVCRFTTLAHAQFTVSRLQRGTNENGWPASSSPCVPLCARDTHTHTQSAHVHALINWWLLAERGRCKSSHTPEEDTRGKHARFEANRFYLNLIQFYRWHIVYFFFFFYTVSWRKDSDNPKHLIRWVSLWSEWTKGWPKVGRVSRFTICDPSGCNSSHIIHQLFLEL